MNKIVLRLTNAQLDVLEGIADSRQCSEAEAAVDLIDSFARGELIGGDVRTALDALIKCYKPLLGGLVADKATPAPKVGKVKKVVRGRPPLLTGELVDIARTFRETGMSFKNIAEELTAQGIKCSQHAVARALAG